MSLALSKRGGGGCPYLYELSHSVCELPPRQRKTRLRQRRVKINKRRRRLVLTAEVGADTIPRPCCTRRQRREGRWRDSGASGPGQTSVRRFLTTASKAGLTNSLMRSALAPVRTAAWALHTPGSLSGTAWRVEASVGSHYRRSLHKVRTTIGDLEPGKLYHYPFSPSSSSDTLFRRHQHGIIIILFLYIPPNRFMKRR